LLRAVNTPLRAVNKLRADMKERRGILALTVVLLALYLVDSLTRYRSYLTDGYDLGIFDQAVRAYAHFQSPIVALKGQGFNLLGDHFHPIIAILAPLYWIWDNPCVLLIGQAVVVVASVPVVYGFTRRRAGGAASLLVAAGYGLGWPVLSLIDFDFHEIAFANLFMALAIDALDRRDDRRLVIWAAALLLVREDMGLLVALLGVLAMFRNGSLSRGGLAAARRRLSNGPVPWVAASLIIGGAAVFELTTAVVLPAFAPNHQYAYWQYDALGKNVPDVVITVFTKPWHLVTVFFSPALKVHTLGYLLLPLLLLPLRSPYALLSLPIFAERFFNSRDYLWSPHWQYNALPWLILVLAAVDGAGRFGWFGPGRVAGWGRRAFLCCLLVSPVLVGLFSDGTTGQPQNPMRRLAGPAWRTTPRLAEQRAAAAAVPGGVCVEADDRIVTHLTARDYASLPGIQNETADFIVLDLSEDNVGNFGPAPATVEEHARAAGYIAAFRQGSLLVLRSPRYTGPSLQCRPLGHGK
jgi:uncharacterized membrane protein